LTTPLPDVLEYNGLDTWHDLRLYYLFRDQLKAQPRLARLFARLMIPAVCELVLAERHGVYVDKKVLDLHHSIAREKLHGIEQELTTYVPPKHIWPDNIREMNFGPSNFARWFLFDHLQLPIMARGKTKDDGSPGQPSMAEAIMLDLADQTEKVVQDGDPNIPQLMLDRALWFKRVTGFFEPYTRLIDHNSRIHTTFKPWGTVTGRLSSGKEDVEKITTKGDVHGANLQQVPRDPFMRGVFGAAPGFWFVEADYSQIELRIAAFMAREDTMLHMFANGIDIHMAMAMRMTGKPASAITKEERKRAKAVNFGYLFGMGVNKFIETAWSNYQLRVTEQESRAFRTSFFNEFPKLVPWHSRQRRLAHKFGRVETPMGRVRHLPDIYSPMKDVQAEAERQAINSPVQAMASDMALLSLVLVSRKFREAGLDAHAIGTVHDAVNFEIPQKETTRALPIIKDTMENLPLDEWFGVHLDVPIIADLKLGTHWGRCS
jgi:DNA polymerase-1